MTAFMQRALREAETREQKWT